MSSAAWKATDILGLTPAIDLRRSDKTYVVGGKNFAFTSRGPRSVYGSRYLLPYPMGSVDHVQGVRIRLRSGDRIFTFTGEAILEWDETVGGWQVIWVTPVTNLTPYRWTYGYLNGKIFFCHPRAGIVVYDIENESVYLHNGPGVSTSPLAICVNNGRLIIMDDIYLYWSWQSDGLNFTPALSEAGFQKISDRVAGFPIMINSYAQGVLLWTTGGVMRSEFTGDQEVYRHRNLNTEFRPINSMCTLQTDENTIVFLDERGLYQSNGGPPTPYAPLFNEFLIEFIRKNDLSVGQNVRIEWDDLRRFMYVSVSLTPESQLYQRAYVLYPALDKWGVMSETHYGILPVEIDGNQRGGSYFGYVDTDSRLNYWSDFASREVQPTGNGLNMRYPLIQKNTFSAEGDQGLVVSSSLTLNSEPMRDFDYPAGFYLPNSNTSATPITTGLDAKVQIGLIRFESPDVYDHTFEIIGVMLGNIESGPNDVLSEDYLTVPDGVDDEDWNVVPGSDDLGVELLTYVNHDLRVVGTIDGQTPYVEENPALVEFFPAARHFSCSVPGIWHILEISANSAGQAFHLQAVELTAVDAGRFE